MLQMLVAVLPLSMQMGWLLHCTEVHLSTLALCFYHHLLIKWIPCE
uniref:Uncharacterized protein n=1 Tax=Setaria viridis TaxID=4556 RepID=A0A4U6TFM6_SETVI|nr:hypothetical protein SEVIR_8G069950v2 [Setaria viridis]